MTRLDIGTGVCNDKSSKAMGHMRSYSVAVMDDTDAQNLLVLAIFAGSLIAVIVGYLFAWRSKRPASRRAGSLTVAVVAGLAGVFMSIYVIGSIMPFPPPDGGPVWPLLILLLVISPLPLGAFYISAKFVRRAFREDTTHGPSA